jgi:hypothetical protein
MTLDVCRKWPDGPVSHACGVEKMNLAPMATVFTSIRDRKQLAAVVYGTLFGLAWCRKAALFAGWLFLQWAGAHSVVAADAEPRRSVEPPPVTRSVNGPTEGKQIERLLQRLEEQNAKLAEQNAKLIEQNARLEKQNQSLAERLEAGNITQNTPGYPAEQRVTSGGLPKLPSPPIRILNTSPPPASPPAHADDHHDAQGQVILAKSREGERMPYELRADIFSQARYSYFARDADYWINSTGAIQPVGNFNSIELTRNFIQLSGYAIDPRLQFTANLFSSTALNSTVFLGWMNFRFSEAFDLRAGNWIVPGTREWNESFRYTLGADRLMATTFFRPNISPGIWAQGEPWENFHYIAMVANSLNRFNQGVERVGSTKAFGGTVWWEPMGPFGLGPSDIENHARPSPRIGTNVAFSRESNQGFGTTESGNPEDTILRLSDGTPLFRPNVLAPGVELRSTSVSLWTIDAALKYRGFSLSSEYFLRWLYGFSYVGREMPIGSLFDQGALLQSGYFLMPSKLETFARSSFVTGHFGGGYEVGGGVNWYFRNSRDWRATFEILNINHSPAQNLLTGYRAGESGMLYQLQLFTDFF